LFCNLIFAQDTLCCNKYDSLQRKTGKWIEVQFFEGDSLKTTCYYKNGLPEGKSITLYPNGKIESELYFKKGKLDGKNKYFYKNGALQDIFINDNGETLLHIKFAPNGEIFQESDKKGLIQYKKGKPNK
jgi:antitoxin component YwqK of YwqJK toxin-antitoxin module